MSVIMRDQFNNMKVKDSECDLWWPGRSFHPWRLWGWGRPCPGCRSCRSSGPPRRTCPAPSPWHSPDGPGTGPSGPPSVCPSPCPWSTPCGRSHTAAPPSTQRGRSHCTQPPPHCCCCQIGLTLKDREGVGFIYIQHLCIDMNHNCTCTHTHAHKEKHTCSEEAGQGDWNRNSGESEQDNHLNRPCQTASACCLKKVSLLLEGRLSKVRLNYNWSWFNS